jgi:hypothetical protein
MSLSLLSLWLPILLSAIAVFLVSSLIWAVVQYHNSDWKKLPAEDAARAALKDVPPGQYSLPHACDNKARQDPAHKQKSEEGPNALLVVLPNGAHADMGKQLISWFAYCLVISLLVAYVAGATLGAGAPPMKVFQVTATVAALAYAGQAASNSIWFAHTWGRTAKDIVDGVIYGLFTAGLFAWLWP